MSKLIGKYLWTLAIIFLVSCTTINKKQIKTEIRQVLNQQQNHWNNGNIVDYMQDYVNSDSLIFIGSTGITYGWQTTLNNYKNAYSTPEKMGKLNFTINKIDVLNNQTAFVIGKWQLTRKTDTPNGHFSLLFKKINNKWKIVADHSS